MDCLPTQKSSDTPTDNTENTQQKPVTNHEDPEIQCVFMRKPQTPFNSEDSYIRKLYTSLQEEMLTMHKTYLTCNNCKKINRKIPKHNDIVTITLDDDDNMHNESIPDKQKQTTSQEQSDQHFCPSSILYPVLNFKNIRSKDESNIPLNKSNSPLSNNKMPAVDLVIHDQETLDYDTAIVEPFKEQKKHHKEMGKDINRKKNNVIITITSDDEESYVVTLPDKQKQPKSEDEFDHVPLNTSNGALSSNSKPQVDLDILEENTMDYDAVRSIFERLCNGQKKSLTEMNKDVNRREINGHIPKNVHMLDIKSDDDDSCNKSLPDKQNQSKYQGQSHQHFRIATGIVNNCEKHGSTICDVVNLETLANNMDVGSGIDLRSREDNDFEPENNLKITSELGDSLSCVNSIEELVKSNVDRHGNATPFHTALNKSTQTLIPDKLDRVVDTHKSEGNCIILPNKNAVNSSQLTLLVSGYIVKKHPKLDNNKYSAQVINDRPIYSDTDISDDEIYMFTTKNHNQNKTISISSQSSIAATSAPEESALLGIETKKTNNHCRVGDVVEHLLNQEKEYLKKIKRNNQPSVGVINSQSKEKPLMVNIITDSGSKEKKNELHFVENVTENDNDLITLYAAESSNKSFPDKFEQHFDLSTKNVEILHTETGVDQVKKGKNSKPFITDIKGKLSTSSENNNHSSVQNINSKSTHVKFPKLNTPTKRKHLKVKGKRPSINKLNKQQKKFKKSVSNQTSVRSDKIAKANSKITNSPSHITLNETLLKTNQHLDIDVDHRLNDTLPIFSEDVESVTSSNNLCSRDGALLEDESIINNVELEYATCAKTSLGVTEKNVVPNVRHKKRKSSKEKQRKIVKYIVEKHGLVRVYHLCQPDSSGNFETNRPVIYVEQPLSDEDENTSDSLYKTKSLQNKFNCDITPKSECSENATFSNEIPLSSSNEQVSQDTLSHEKLINSSKSIATFLNNINTADQSDRGPLQKSKQVNSNKNQDCQYSQNISNSSELNLSEIVSNMLDIQPSIPNHQGSSISKSSTAEFVKKDQNKYCQPLISNSAKQNLLNYYSSSSTQHHQAILPINNTGQQRTAGRIYRGVSGHDILCICDECYLTRLNPFPPACASSRNNSYTNIQQQRIPDNNNHGMIADPRERYRPYGFQFNNNATYPRTSPFFNNNTLIIRPTCLRPRRVNSNIQMERWYRPDVTSTINCGPPSTSMNTYNNEQRNCHYEQP